MTGDPEEVPPLARMVMLDVQRHGYRAYPLVGPAALEECPAAAPSGPGRSPRRIRGRRPRRPSSWIW